MNPLLTIALAFTLAVATEGAVETVFGQPINFLKALQPYKGTILTYLGLAVGVGLCIFYKVDLVFSMATLAEGSGVQPSTVGFVLTGLIVGRGSNAVHDFISKVLGGRPKPSPAAAKTA